MTSISDNQQNPTARSLLVNQTKEAKEEKQSKESRQIISSRIKRYNERVHKSRYVRTTRKATGTKLRIEITQSYRTLTRVIRAQAAETTAQKHNPLNPQKKRKETRPKKHRKSRIRRARRVSRIREINKVKSTRSKQRRRQEHQIKQKKRSPSL